MISRNDADRSSGASSRGVVSPGGTETDCWRADDDSDPSPATATAAAAAAAAGRSVGSTQRGTPRRAPSERSCRRGSLTRTSSGLPRTTPGGTRRDDEVDDDGEDDDDCEGGEPLRRRTASKRRGHIGC